MAGNFVDRIWYGFKTVPKSIQEVFQFLDTDYGRIRFFDSGGNGPVIINVPDGPNVLEHQQALIEKLSKQYRVIAFEYPGLGFSYPNKHYNYTMDHGAGLLLQVMDVLKIQQAALLFSCSNGFYAMNAAAQAPERFVHLFLSQTPSIAAMDQWSANAIPKYLKKPVTGQFLNAVYAKKLAHVWYKYALPKGNELDGYRQTAHHSLKSGGCFCLSALVQGFEKDRNKPLQVADTPVTLIWGNQDYTHQRTNKESVKDHIPACEIVEFSSAGHFPELEFTDKYVSLVRERY